MKWLNKLFFISLVSLPGLPLANDFPTLERVRYVHECMALSGGSNYINMYRCSCEIDHVAEQISFQQFELADAMNRMRNMRGERASYFRSSDSSRTLRKNLTRLKKQAKQTCSGPEVKQITAGAPSHAKQ